MFDYYFQILELPSTATDHEIKRAYRRLALLYHPDKNKNADAEQKFSEINEAYNILMRREEIAQQFFSQLFTQTNQTANVNNENIHHQNPHNSFNERRETGYKRKMQHEADTKRFFQNSYNKFLKSKWYIPHISATVICILFGALFITDYFLQPINNYISENDVVKIPVQYPENATLPYNYYVELYNQTVMLNPQAVASLSEEDLVIIQTSIIFKDIKSIVFCIHDDCFEQADFMSVFNIFIIPVFLLMPVLYFFIKAPTETFHYFRKPVLFIGLITLIIYLFQSFRFLRIFF